MFFDKAYFDENGNPSEVDVICNKCGKILEIEDINIFQKIYNDYCIVKESEKIICSSCSNIGMGTIKYKQNYNLEASITNKGNSNLNIPKCITCGSTNVQKISSGKKVLGGIAFGLFSSDVRNTMCCNNCGCKW